MSLFLKGTRYLAVTIKLQAMNDLGIKKVSCPTSKPGGLLPLAEVRQVLNK